MPKAAGTGDVGIDGRVGNLDPCPTARQFGDRVLFGGELEAMAGKPCLLLFECETTGEIHLLAPKEEETLAQVVVLTTESAWGVAPLAVVIVLEAFGPRDKDLFGDAAVGLVIEEPLMHCLAMALGCYVPIKMNTVRHYASGIPAVLTVRM